MATSKGSKWGSKLKKSVKGWEESRQEYDQMFGGSDIPEDVYIMQLSSCKLGESDAHTYIRREHVIMEGEHKGVKIGDNMMLTTSKGPLFVRRWLKMLGVEPPKKVEFLEDTLVQLQDEAPIIKGRVSHSTSGEAEYTNVKVISVMGENEDDSEEEVELDDMNLKELRAFVKENDLEIEKYLKLSEDDLREAIENEMGSDEESEEEESEEEESEVDSDADDSGDEDADVIDFEEMDKDDLLEFIKDNEIDPADLGFKNKVKMKKASEDDLREAVQKHVSESEEESEEESDDDELLESAKLFCGTWDIDLEDESDLDDAKKAISECEFPEDELDADEIETLNKLGLQKTIKASKKKKAKAKGKKK